LISFTSFGPWLFGDTSGNAMTEATGLLPAWATYPFIVGSTTMIWIVTTFLTKPESGLTLERFYAKTKPGGPGWRSVKNRLCSQSMPSASWAVPQGVLAMLLGCIVVYGALFATGFWLYGEWTYATLTTTIVLVAAFLLLRVWKKLKSLPQGNA
jgi:hypothetical protein